MHAQLLHAQHLHHGPASLGLVPYGLQHPAHVALAAGAGVQHQYFHISSIFIREKEEEEN